MRNIIKRLDEIENNVSISVEELLNQFKKEYKDSITYGCIRDNCGIPAIDLEMYANKFGFHIPRVYGKFKVDSPQLSKKDFTPDELKQMKDQKYNPNNINDRYLYAKENNLLDELKYIPHYWNEFNGQIIDFTGYTQFVKTGLASDLDTSRYYKN